MKKHLLTLVLIVSFVFAFIPRTFAEEITEPVLDMNASLNAVDETNNINEDLDIDNDANSDSESEDKSDEVSEDNSDEVSEDESEDNKDEEEVVSQDSNSEGEEENTSEPENTNLESSNDQEENDEEKNIEEGNENLVEEVTEVKDEEPTEDENNNSDSYEVIFTREGYKLVIPGGSSILLSQLNSKLGIDISLSDVYEIGISNEEVLRIVKVENSNDYNIQSIKSFTTEETLRILTKDGYEYLIKVVDPVGDPPVHGKDLINNNDGTYTIALTVVGDSEKQVSKVNVIIVLDTSGSMDDPTGTTEETYTATDSTESGLYGLVNGEYLPLRRGWGYVNGNYVRTFYYNGDQYTGTLYTGTRYRRSVSYPDRIDAAKAAVNKIAESLLSNNGENGNPTDTVEMALVTFATNSNVRITKTTNYNTFSNTVNNLDANGGTNWEAALRSANGINFGDDDQVYIIFVSDGNPTFRTTRNGYNDRYQNGIYGTGYEEEPNITRAYETAVTAAKEIVNGGKKLYTIGAYGNVSRMEGLTTESGAPARNYYSAENTTALQDALGSILTEIEMAGIGAVSINDGTTSSVTTSSGVSHLLDVDTTSFKYYKNDEEWTDAPEATLNSNGEVVWDLNEVGVLEDGVEYKVTFVVWPSQTTLDLIADLKNDPNKYDTLDSNIKKYLVNNGDGTYTLLTNTTASLSFKDTREDNPQTHTTEYTNPDPVSTNATQMLTITKEWNNSIDEREKREVKIDVLRDGESWNTLTLNDGNSYSVSTNIAVGIMTVKNGVVEIKAKGHDFSFGELGDEAYNWELKSEVVRPMMLNGELTILIRQGKEEPVEGTYEGTYYKIGEYYYLVGDLDEGVAKLTATNERRSWIDLTKTVNYDENAAQFDDQLFTFDINVVDKEGRDVWFSVKDGDAFVTENDGLEVTGATAEEGSTGYYYAPSGSTFTVKIKAGWNLRIINLLTGTTYTIEEKDIDAKFAFDKIDYTKTKYENENGEEVEYTPELDDKKVSGEIMSTNTAYGYKYINKNVNTEIKVTKVWEDNDDANKNRPNEVVLNLSNGTDIIAQPEKIDNGNGTWIYTYTNLPVYDEDGNKITYKLTEETVLGYKDAVITGDAKEGFVVTNTLETVSVTVAKVWDDNDDQDGIRPESVTLTLSDGTEIVLNDANNWTDTIEDLPKYKNKEEVTYTVTETEVPEGYKVSYSEDNLTAINTHTPAKADVVVTKVWKDESNKEGLRPNEITIHLLANGEEVETTPEITKNKDTWTFTYKDLDVKADGEKIEYTVTEETVENYEKSIDGLTITNSREVEKIDITIKKIWEDNNDQDGIRSRFVLISLFRSTHGEKELVDYVELNDANNWTATIEGLLKFSNGIEYTYTAEEIDVPKGYTASYSDDTFTITNTHEVEKIDITVKKEWKNDDDYIDEVRPESVTIFLFANGEKIETIELSKENDWTYTFKELDVYENNKEIEYTIDEQDVGGYKKSITGNSEEGFIVINEFTGEIGDTVPPITGIEIDNNGSIIPFIFLVLLLLLEGINVSLNKQN